MLPTTGFRMQQMDTRGVTIVWFTPKLSSLADLLVFANIRFLAEHQESLSSVVLTLTGVPSNADDLTIEIETPLEAVLASPSEPEVRSQISLPTPCLLTKHIPAHRSDNGEISMKLAAEPITTSQSLLIARPLDAKELRSFAHTQLSLQCGACQREIACLSCDHTQDQRRIRDLPGEYWAEMSEVWLCHADPSFTEKLEERTKQGFWPNEGEVLVGGNYLLLAPADVKDSSLTIDGVSKVRPSASLSLLATRTARAFTSSRSKRRPSPSPMSGSPSHLVSHGALASSSRLRGGDSRCRSSIELFWLIQRSHIDETRIDRGSMFIPSACEVLASGAYVWSYTT